MCHIVKEMNQIDTKYGGGSAVATVSAKNLKKKMEATVKIFIRLNFSIPNFRQL